ncbi:MAG: nucleoside-diphosphate kinase [Bacteroidales bacterium]|nr:nucleoside-diphosphate kinase [Bacteroidales bacterium]
MEKEYTLSIIKPDAVERNLVGKILNFITEAGFKIVGLKMMMVNKYKVEEFYAEHKGKSFFNDLVEYMRSGPIVAVLLEKENAVEDFRKLIGDTDPAKAEDGTIRKMFGISVQKNSIHGSDSRQSALRESEFFFASYERFFF